MQKIGEIKCEIQAAEPGEYATLFEKYKEDTRSGVRKLLEQLHKKEEAYQKELLRTEKMKEFERKYEDLGYVCGIDEVGRGPLAAVNGRKQLVISKVAVEYLKNHYRSMDVRCRFDVVGINGDKICWIKNAFDFCQ